MTPGSQVSAATAPQAIFDEQPTGMPTPSLPFMMCKFVFGSDLILSLSLSLSLLGFVF
jgi:hypothetical protein